VEDFEKIMIELESFSADLAKKPMFLVASKIDVAQDEDRIEALRGLAKEKGLPFFAISSATGQGIQELKYAMAGKILA
jgi:GTP-binding protein